MMSGPKEKIDSFFKFYIKMLSKAFLAEGKMTNLSGLEYVCHPIDSLSHLLNVIVYIHRNASVTDKMVSPYTYKWGTGRYFFNPEACLRYHAIKQKVTLSQRQLYSHSRKFDDVSGLYEKVISALTVNQKLRLAQTLHYDYNSSNKQI